MPDRPSRHWYIVAIGSNIEPEKNTKAVLSILKKETKLQGTATFRKTAPVGYQNQADFLNSAVYMVSDSDYGEFRAYLKSVEKDLGRVKGKFKSGPRTIDLDIIIHNGKVVDEDFYTASYISEPVSELIENYDLKIASK